MSELQLAWVIVGLLFGFLAVIPIKRCRATYNGILSILTASLMGIFNVSFSWIAVCLGIVCFSYGLYQNRHKYLGVAHDRAN